MTTVYVTPPTSKGSYFPKNNFLNKGKQNKTTLSPGQGISQQVVQPLLVSDLDVEVLE